jgi:tRNA uridine 5-carboxymethylaminomethyl modification enzyme
MDEAPLKDVSTAQQLVARKSFTVEKMLKLVPELAKFDDYIKEEILVEGKYARYIDKQTLEIERMKKYLKVKIPEDFDFTGVSGLSKEVQEKLAHFSPPTLQAAMNISGITPAAIEILHIYIRMAAKK